MFGLPENFDSSFLVGRSLLQVCIGLHEVIFKFDENVVITAECEFKVATAERSKVFDVPREGGAAALVLLQETVSDARGSNDGTLLLVFPSGTIELYDTSPNCECYQIQSGSEVYVV